MMLMHLHVSSDLFLLTLPGGFFMYEKYFEQLKEECLIRNRSSKTAETYISNITSFMKWTGNKPMEELSLQDAREFILFKRKC